MVRLDNNLKIRDVWFTFAPEMKLSGGNGSAKVRKTLNGKHVFIALPSGDPMTIECNGGDSSVISTLDAAFIFNLWSTKSIFSIEAQGVLPDGQGIKAERCCILERPELRYGTDGVQEGSTYNFTITILGG